MRHKKPRHSTLTRGAPHSTGATRAYQSCTADHHFLLRNACAWSTTGESSSSETHPASTNRRPLRIQFVGAEMAEAGLAVCPPQACLRKVDIGSTEWMTFILLDVAWASQSKQSGVVQLRDVYRFQICGSYWRARWIVVVSSDERCGYRRCFRSIVRLLVKVLNCFRKLIPLLNVIVETANQFFSFYFVSLWWSSF